MNRYLLIHRLMGPAVLLLLGTIALLHQAHIASWNLFVPLLLILIGVIKLAERAALASQPPPQEPYPGMPYQGMPYQGSNYPGAPYQAPGAGAVPPAAPAHDAGTNVEGDRR